MKKFLAVLKKEFLELLPPFIFFAFVFHIMMLVESLMAKASGFSYSATTTALIGAVLVSKSILIVDALPMLKFKEGKKIIYPMTWRVFFYIIIVVIFQFIEELIPLFSESDSFSDAVTLLFTKIKWDHFWAVHIVLFLFLVIYTMVNAVIDILGAKKFLAIFFSSDRNI